MIVPTSFLILICFLKIKHKWPGVQKTQKIRGKLKLFPDALLACLGSSSVIYNNTRSVAPRVGRHCQGATFLSDAATALGGFPKRRTCQCSMREREVLDWACCEVAQNGKPGSWQQTAAQYWYWGHRVWRELAWTRCCAVTTGYSDF